MILTGFGPNFPTISSQNGLSVNRPFGYFCKHFCNNVGGIWGLQHWRSIALDHSGHSIESPHTSTNKLIFCQAPAGSSAIWNKPLCFTFAFHGRIQRFQCVRHLLWIKKSKSSFESAFCNEFVIIWSAKTFSSEPMPQGQYRNTLLVL